MKSRVASVSSSAVDSTKPVVIRVQVVMKRKRPSSSKYALYHTVRQAMLDIGWDAAYLDTHFDKVKLEMETTDYFVRLQAFHFMGLADPTGSFQTRLKQMGLHPHAARYYAALLEPLKSSYTHDQLLDTLLDVVLNRIPFVAGVPLGNWLHNGAEATWQTRFIKNIPTKAINVRMGSKVPDFLVNRNFVFHATSWTGATNILEHGIKLTLGKRCTDFGMERSFYTTPSYATALAWSRIRKRVFHGQCAIVVYEWNARPKQFKERRYDEPNQEWEKRVAESRKCHAYETSTLDTMDMVYGPIAVNPEHILHGGTPIPHDPPQFQWAVKSERAAKFADAHLYGVVWFQALQEEPTRGAPKTSV